MMITNWKATALGAWSMWGFYLLLLLEGAPAVLGALSPALRPSDMAMSVVTVIAIAAGAILRLIAQPTLAGQT